jgi:hypothetical protein
MNKLPLLLLGLLLGACGMLRAQSFDLATGRLPVASLDGLWRFHTGDNPAWADPNFDDSGWSLLRSDQDWSSQGYKNYTGMAWYRFQVTVPAELDHVSLSLPPIASCYEVYADGKLIGSLGKMPPNNGPESGGPPFQAYPLPAGKNVDRRIEIALRIWHWPGWAKSLGGGPQDGGGQVGFTKEIEDRDLWIRNGSLWQNSEYEILALLETLAGLGTLALFLLRRKEPEYVSFSLMMLFMATTQGLLFFEITTSWNGSWVDLDFGAAYAGADFAAIAFYQLLLQPSRAWMFKLAVTSAALLLSLRILFFLSGERLDIWLVVFLGSLFDLVVYMWIISVVLSSVRKRSPEARLLAAPVILTTAEHIFRHMARTTYFLGWQQVTDGSISLTETPFTIQLQNATDALFLVAVFGILILRFTRTRSQEERFESEVQAAREIQQYLIPSHLPLTPGLTIESEYRPAREVGGDFFQVLPSAEDGSVLLVLGDVAGKGLHAGMLATLIVGAVRTAAKFTTEPEKILALLNDRLQGRGLVTCLALLIERDGNVTLANAGHLPPYLNDREMPMEGALPLGAIPGVEFSVMHFQLAEGDSLMLMSDGIAEAQDAHGHLFGFERIATMLSERATAASLASAAQNFGQEDDITVLTVARLAPALIG